MDCTYAARNKRSEIQNLKNSYFLLTAIVRSSFKTISISMHLLLWMNCMLDFSGMGFAELWGTGNIKWNENICLFYKLFASRYLRPLGHTLTDDNLFLIILHNHCIWIKSTRGNICIKLILVRFVLELTVTQNLFFYQCRYLHVLLFTCK